MLEILFIYFLAILFSLVIFFLHSLYCKGNCHPNLTFKDLMDDITPEVKKYLISLTKREGV